MFSAMPRAETSRFIFLSLWGIKSATALKGLPFKSPLSLANFPLIVQLPPSGRTSGEFSEESEALEVRGLFDLEAC